MLAETQCHKEGSREVQLWLRCRMLACPVRRSVLCPQYKLCIVAQAYNPRFRRQRQEDQEFKGYLLVHSKFEAIRGYMRYERGRGEGGKEQREGESQRGSKERKQKEEEGEGSRGWEVGR